MLKTIDGVLYRNGEYTVRVTIIDRRTGKTLQAREYLCTEVELSEDIGRADLSVLKS